MYSGRVKFVLIFDHPRDFALKKRNENCFEGRPFICLFEDAGLHLGSEKRA